MKYVITQEQKNFLMTAFGEVKASISFQPLLLLNQLEALPEEDKNIEPTGGWKDNERA